MFYKASVLHHIRDTDNYVGPYNSDIFLLRLETMLDVAFTDLNTTKVMWMIYCKMKNKALIVVISYLCVHVITMRSTN